jgi:SAM-dependent methyltransferase
MENEIESLYKFIKKDKGYLTKYNPLPSCPVKMYDYNWANYDFPRNICILDFIEWIKKYNIEVDDLGYTYDDPELEFIKYKNKHLIMYPEYDLHKPFGHNCFDFFLFNQTIEHLYNPLEAIKNIYNSLKPNGYVFTSAPTINIPHMTPFHFNGYTPIGLAMLFKLNNFEIIEMGQWGNFEYIKQLFETHSWPGAADLCNNIQNEECNVCQCWILAKKNKTI